MKFQLDTDILKKTFHYLASIRFAIVLITLTAAIVAIGTILESRTGSHLYAAQWTYHHPIFQWLLALFFVNILFSTIRRWPFKIKHIPFLITHLGLLMIISGTMIKNRYGLQGHLFVWEGSGNSHIFIPHTYALNIENRGSHPGNVKKDTIPLHTLYNNTYYSRAFPSLKCQVIASAPHVEEKFDQWIKQGKTSLLGFPPIPVQEWKKSDPLPPFIYTSMYGRRKERCGLLCLQVDDLSAAIETIYLHQLSMHIASKDPLIATVPIDISSRAFNKEKHGDIHTALSTQIDNDEFTPALTISTKKQKIHLSLAGANALSPSLQPYPWIHVKEKINLTRPCPLLCILQDKKENIWLAAFDQFGRISTKQFPSDQLQEITIYDSGFGGYAVQTELLAPSFPATLDEIERAKKHLLKVKLSLAMESNPPLAPPLELLKQAAVQADEDFIDAFVEFLYDWNNQSNLLFTPFHSLPDRLEKILSFIAWHDLPQDTLHSLMWTSSFLQQLQSTFDNGIDLERELKQSQWPFIDHFQKEKTNRQLPSLLAQQMASISSSLPPLPFPQVLASNEHAILLSTYLLLFDITFSNLTGDEPEEQVWSYFLQTLPANHSSHLTLETPLTNRLKVGKEPDRLEEALPGIAVDFFEEGKEQRLVFAYDPTLEKIKWPLFGEYKIAFQPILKEIPYRIRLRQARRISYPNTTQTYSYESDLIITEMGEKPIEQTVSMNRVYETWDGYRFYLAGIGTGPNQGPKKIQLIVNYDPAKYFFTYPGAALVFLGAILLFWWRPYRKKENSHD